jgi:LPS-assembly protein
MLLLALKGAGAAELELFKAEPLPGEAWRIRAEQLTYDSARHIYTGEGRVELRQGLRRITADYAQVNEVTKVAYFRGNVVLVMEEDIYTGAEGTFNLATQCGEMKEARLFLKTNHFQLRGALIRKTGDNTYYAEDSTITTCDADRPVWSFHTQKLNVVVEGYAKGEKAVPRLAGVPVLYLPYAVLPAITQRQTGFLLPFFGQQRVGGTVMEFPFFWAMDNSHDATLFQTYLSNRGYMQGVELRSRGYGEAAANFRGFYLNEGRDEAPTPHRYWVTGMVNQPLGDDWEFRGTLDRVSDRAYLKDFNFGYMALNRYSRDMLTEFGRDLEEQEVSTRVSTALVSNNLNWANFTGYARYYERLRPSDPRLFNRLPSLGLYTLPLPLGGLPLLLGLNGSYTYFYQDKGMDGDRLDLHPRLWLKTQPLSGVSFSSAIGFRETIFRVDKNVTGGPQEGYLTRQLFDSQVSLAGAFVRDYGRGGDSGDSSTFVRHVLRPEITYWNLPRYTAARYPGFDPFDKGWVAHSDRNLPIREGDNPYGGVNALTYSLGNNLLIRGQNPQGQTTVKDWIWFRLSQSAFFNSSNMGLDGTNQPHHRFSDFWGEMEYYPFRQLILGANVGVSPYKEGFERADIKVIFTDRLRQHYLNVSYIYIKDFASQINIQTYVNLLPSVKSWVTYSRTFETDKKLENRYGLVLQRQCWGVAFSYTERPDDRRFGFSIFIPGLGEKLKRSPVRFPEEGRFGKEGPDTF